MISEHKILIVLLCLTCSIILAEIKYDKTRWKAGKSDKPISTILRSGLIALVVIVNWIATGDFMSALKTLGVIFGTYLLVFDFALNVSRWKELGANFYKRQFRPYYRPFHSKFPIIIPRDDIDGILSHVIQWKYVRKSSYQKLTFFQKLYWNWIKFEYRFFYHGISKPFNFKDLKTYKNLYDHIFMSIPWSGELLFKGTMFGVLIWFYYS